MFFLGLFLSLFPCELWGPEGGFTPTTPRVSSVSRGRRAGLPETAHQALGGHSAPGPSLSLNLPPAHVVFDDGLEQ